MEHRNNPEKQELLKNSISQYLMLKEQYNSFIGKEFLVDDFPKPKSGELLKFEVKVGILRGGEVTIENIEDFNKYDLETQVVNTQLYLHYKSGNVTGRITWDKFMTLNAHLFG
jgi:hypothetical protein